jgi:predicted Rossmann-fold nucleotide-binding protein
MVKIGIVGSRIWTDRDKMSKVVKYCIKKYGSENICIVSGGAKGADSMGRELALENNLSYVEYNPAHTPWNKYSGKPKEWYGKTYHVGHFFERNTFIAEDSDILLAFIPENHQSNGTMDTVTKMRKLNKPCKIIN